MHTNRQKRSKNVKNALNARASPLGFAQDLFAASANQNGADGQTLKKRVSGSYITAATSS